MAGLTPQGFVAKRLAELKVELETGLSATFGNINLNPESVFGQLIGTVVDQQADLWARLEQVYHSQYPDSAAGVSLDRAADLNGIVRLPAAPTQVVAVVSGTPGTVLPAGRLAMAENGAMYTLTDDTTISATVSVGARLAVATLLDNTDYSITLGAAVYTYNSGPAATAASILTNLAALLPAGVTSQLTAGAGGTWIDIEYTAQQLFAVGARLTLVQVSSYADFRNTVPGAVELPARALSTIQTPVAGWTTVTNRAEGTLGRDVETDLELRQRRARSLRLTGSNTLDAIRSALSELPGVLSMRVVDNRGTATDAEGTPRQTVWAVVDGGTADDIARVLYERVAAGINYRGATEVGVVSPTNSQSFPVRFDRPVNVPYYVNVTIRSSAVTPTNIIDLAREALVAYSNAAYGIGDDVLYTRLFSPLNAIVGEDAYVSALTVGLTADPTGTANLVSEPAERFLLTEGRVQVFVVAP